MAVVHRGLAEERWRCAMDCYCYLRNVDSKMIDDNTADEKTRCCTFSRMFDPVRSRRQLQKPISSKCESQLHHLDKKMLLGLFMGYVLRAGGGWSGALLNADCEELENLSVLENYSTRFRHQAVSQEGTLSFPCADGALKLFDLLQPDRGERDTSSMMGPSPMRKVCTMWRTLCCARLRIVRAVRSCKDSYTKKSCVRWLCHATFRWVCCSSVRTERQSVSRVLLDWWSALSTGAASLKASAVQEGLQQYGECCDGREVRVWQ